jgi:NAD-dependent DNA ligase
MGSQLIDKKGESMEVNKDDQGQLQSKSINAQSVADRKVDELIGICRGIIADGEVNKSEAEFLLSWIKSNIHSAPQYPFNILYNRITEMLSDGIMDEDEQKDLLTVLTELTGGNIIADKADSMSTTLPLTNPPPSITIKDHSFVFTGVFNSGARKNLEQLVIDIGGVMHKSITKETNYLVIGDIGSHDWKHSSFGRKIEKAMEYQELGTGIAIVTESHWMKYL